MSQARGKWAENQDSLIKQLHNLDPDLTAGQFAKKYLFKFPDRSKGAVERRFHEVVRYQEEDASTASEHTSESELDLVSELGSVSEFGSESRSDSESDLSTAQIVPGKRPASSDGTNTAKRTKTSQAGSDKLGGKDGEDTAAQNAISAYTGNNQDAWRVWMAAKRTRNLASLPREQDSSSVSSDSHAGDIEFSGYVRLFRQWGHPMDVPAIDPIEDQTSGLQWELSGTVGAMDGPFPLVQDKEIGNASLSNSTTEPSSPEQPETIKGPDSVFIEISERDERGSQIFNAGSAAQDGAEPNEAIGIAATASLENLRGLISDTIAYGNAARNIATRLENLDLDSLEQVLRLTHEKHAVEISSLNSQHMAQLQEQERKSAHLEAKFVQQMEVLTRKNKVLAEEMEMLCRQLQPKTEKADQSDDLLSRMAILRQKSGLVGAKKGGT